MWEFWGILGVWPPPQKVRSCREGAGPGAIPWNGHHGCEAQQSAHGQLLEQQREEALAAVQDRGGLVKRLHWNTWKNHNGVRALTVQPHAWEELWDLEN